MFNFNPVEQAVSVISMKDIDTFKLAMRLHKYDENFEYKDWEYVISMINSLNYLPIEIVNEDDYLGRFTNYMSMVFRNVLYHYEFMGHGKYLMIYPKIDVIYRSNFNCKIFAVDVDRMSIYLIPIGNNPKPVEIPSNPVENKVGENVEVPF